MADEPIWPKGDYMQREIEYLMKQEDLQEYQDSISMATDEFFTAMSNSLEIFAKSICAAATKFTIKTGTDELGK